MEAADVIARLRENAPELRARGVARAAVFGSVARGEAGPDSDIDIGVRLDPAARIGVYEYVDVVQFLQGLFPARVDVANLNTLYPRVRAAVERDLLYAF